MTATDLAAPPAATVPDDDRITTDARRVAQNVVDVAINRFCPPIFSLLIVIAVARVSSSLLGWYAVVGVYFVALQTLPYLGLTPWIMREAAQRPTEVGVVFGSSIALAAVAAAALLAGLPLALGAAGYPPEVNQAIWIAALTMAPYIVAYACELIFVTVHRTTFIRVVPVVENAGRLVLSLAALWLGYGLVALFWIAFASRAGAAITYALGLKRLVLRGQRIAADPRMLREMVRVSPVFLLNTALVLLVQRGSLLVLSWYTPPERIAEFSVAYRPLEIGMIAIAAVVGAVYPHLARADAGSRQFRWFSSTLTRLVLVSAVVSSAVILIGSDTIVSTLFPKQFPEAASLLAVLMLTLPAAGLRLSTSGMLLAKGRAGADLMALAAGAAVQVVLLLWWVPIYGAWGAAWALVAEGAAQAVLRLVLVRHWYDTPSLARMMAVCLVAAGAIGAGSAIGAFLTSPAAETVAAVLMLAVLAAIVVRGGVLGHHDLRFLGLPRGGGAPPADLTQG